jgi:ribosomal-protein-alanine N-acetyltransferase
MDSPQVELRTPRLLLRPLRPDDRIEWLRVHALSAELHDPWSPKYNTSLEQRFETDLQRTQIEWADGTGARFVAILPNGCHAAYVNLSQIIQKFFQNASIGWRGNAEITRQGYCTEAVHRVLDYAFAPPPNGLGLHRVQAGVIPQNVASLRVAEKCGFRREGLAVRYLQINGLWQDHIILAKLADEHTIPRIAPS